MSRPKYIFKTTDPLKNRVVLTQDTWDKHILARHPEMEDKEEVIRQVVENPHYIFERKATQTKIYCLEDETKPEFINVYAKTFDKIDISFIRTAFTSSHPKIGKKIWWRKSRRNEQKEKIRY